MKEHNHHHHAHGHHHELIHPKDFNFAFVVSILVNSLFIVIQVIFAFLADSMSLMADAGHNFSDVLGLLLAFGASWLGRRKATERYSYGYKRTTIFAALSNALMLVAATTIIAYHSIIKIFHPEPVNEIMIMIVAFVGIFVNGGTALLFLKGRHADLNIRGAFLHLAYDSLISLGVVLGGVAILITHQNWIDPLVGLIIVVLIFIGTWGLFRDSVNLMLDGVPKRISHKSVRDYLLSLSGVTGVHDLHIWGLSTHEIALTAHLIMPTQELSDEDHLTINEYLQEHFKINHVTIQVEKGTKDNPCGQTETC